MANWIFIATNHKTGDGELTGRRILEQRIEDKFWGLGERTPNRKSLKKGDRIIFYVGSPDMAFSATATLASDSFSPTENRREELSHEQDFFRSEYGVDFENAAIWTITKPISELAHSLDFIGKRPDWWVFLQGGVRGISDVDYNRIIQHATGTSETQITIQPQAEPAAGDQLFALEKHLEDFIEKNWSKILWRRKLSLYKSDAGTGRQFPAGDWNIDFLATDDLETLVVIELKRGRSSDDVIGQVLRYIGWVRENLARPDQKVEGIIICSEIDNELKYAVRELENVSVMKYRVSFSLTEPEL
jgi:hypothetical protein